MSFQREERVTTLSGVDQIHRYYKQMLPDGFGDDLEDAIIVAVTSDDVKLWLLYRDRPLNHDGFVGSADKKHDDLDLVVEEAFRGLEVSSKINRFLQGDEATAVLDDLRTLTHRLRTPDYVLDVINNARHLLDVTEAMLNL